MSKEDKIIGKRPAWLNIRLLRYGAAALVLVAVFVAALCGAVNVMGHSRMETICARLSERNIEAYTDSKAHIDHDLALETEHMREQLKMLAVMVNTYNSLASLPSWDLLLGGMTFSPDIPFDIWLLGESGGVLRGSELPSELDASSRRALTRMNNYVETGDAVYQSVHCAYGVLVGRTDLSLAKSRDGGLQSLYKEDGAFSFVISPEDMVYGWTEDIAESIPLASLCEDIGELKTAQGALLTLNGTTHYCMAQTIDNGDTLVTAVPQQALHSSIWAELQIPIVLFATAVLAIALYALIMRGVQGSALTQGAEVALPLLRGFYINTKLLARLAAVALGGIVFFIGTSWLVITLSAYAQHNVRAGQSLTEINDTAASFLSDADKDFLDFWEICDNNTIYLADAVVVQPAMTEPANLSAVSNAIHVKTTTLYEQEAYEIICTDARVYGKNGNMLATGNDVLSGSTPGLNADILATLEEGGGWMFFYNFNQEYISICRLTDGTERYVLMKFEASERFASWAALTDKGDASIDDDIYQAVTYADSFNTGDDSRVLLARASHRTEANSRYTLLYPNGDAYGYYEDAYALADFEPEALRAGYTGDQIINGENYYINVRRYTQPEMLDEEDGNEHWLIYATPARSVAGARMPLLLWVACIGSVLLLLMAFGAALRHGKPPVKAEENAFTERAARRTRTMNGHRINGPTMGWGVKSDWGSKTPEEQFMSTLGNLFLAAIVVMLLLGVMQGAFQTQSVIRYIMKGDWDKDFNIFSCTYVAMVLVVSFSFSSVVRGALRFITGNFGPRSETMGRLFSSLVQYATYIAAGLHLLHFFGVNMSVLLASAGLLTLVLSPTLNLLLGDVSAGILIVFEDEYRVGDIVSINGWRGVVLEITLRTTMLEDLMGNIKVFNNAKITEIENLTEEYTTSVITVNVPYEEPINHIEKVLEEELPKIKDKIKTVVGTPTYEGVEEFGSSGVLIRIHVMSREEFRFAMMRRFRHELKAMFERRGIQIPYTQIVLRDAEDEVEAAVYSTAGNAHTKE